MRSQPRTDCRFRPPILLALVLALLSTPVWAQQRRRAKSSPEIEIKAAERAQRAQAVALLMATADKARLFDDLFYRARIQTLAADALWPHDERQARAILRRAWEAATVSDKEEQEAAAQETGALPGAVAKVTEARDEVLKIAAARENRLAETFLHDLLSDKEGNGNASRNEPARNTLWHELSAGGARRLSLAYELLEAGEPRRAVELAAPLIIEGISADLITFILRLRERSIPDADALYLRLLERAAADSQTNADTVLLLSSFVISPNLLVAVDEFGSLQFRAVTLSRPNSAAQQPVAQRAQTVFYNLAASVLSRPVRERDGALTIQELMARFYATGRLLPFFENSSAPYAAFAPALRARHSELFNEIEASRREQFSAQFSVSSLTQTATTDPLRLPTEQLSRATDSTERERIALSMVRTATRNRSWDRARRSAAEIENTELRHAALSFIQVHQIKDISKAYSDDKEDDFESIVKFVREADVPPFARAWGLAQAALIAARKQSPQTSQNVMQLLGEAESYASRVAQGTPERVAAYGSVMLAAARLDRPRAWSVLRELVRAANAVEDFTGDGVSLDLSADETSSDETTERFIVEAELFRLDGIFATMAQLDFEKALAEARALDGDVPRAFATIAAARTILEKQNPGVRIQNQE